MLRSSRKNNALSLSWFNHGNLTKFEHTFFQISKSRISPIFAKITQSLKILYDRVLNRIYKTNKKFEFKGKIRRANQG